MRIGRRFWSRDSSVTKGSRKKSSSALDGRLTFRRAGQTWTWDDGHIYIDNYDVNELASDRDTGVQTLVALAGGLQDYKRRVRDALVEGDTENYSSFWGLVDALLGKVMGRVKSVYDEKIFGLQWELSADGLLINGVNVPQFIAMYRIRPTQKARQFLKGIQGKVEMLLANPAGNFRNEKSRWTLLALQREIDELLAARAPTDADTLALPAGSSSR